MKVNAALSDVLRSFSEGTISQDEAENLIFGLRFDVLGEYARLDTGREVRCGMPEVVLAEGKDIAHLLEIVIQMTDISGRCIATRMTPKQAESVSDACSAKGYTCTHHKLARICVISRVPPAEKHGGIVGVITAGTADVPVAEEARVMAEEMGCLVRTAYDVGAAGIHRLFPAMKDLMDAHVFVVAAGREGTLPAIIAGLVDRPVIGVPVSSGYGYMGHGEAALASMLQACSVLTVVNIDAGFTAGAFAARIAQMGGGQ